MSQAAPNFFDHIKNAASKRFNQVKAPHLMCPSHQKPYTECFRVYQKLHTKYFRLYRNRQRFLRSLSKKRTKKSFLSPFSFRSRQRVRTFNLNRLDEIRSHLNRAYKIFSNINIKDNSNRTTIKVFQFDVKQMFTWLAQSSTMQSLRFALANIIFQPLKSRNWKPIVDISKMRKHTGKYDVGWNRSYAPQDYIAFTFEDIINIVCLDFAHSHFTLGDAENSDIVGNVKNHGGSSSRRCY
eukprot:g35708.t1